MKRVILSAKARQAIDAIWLYWAERVSEAVAERQVDRIWAGLGVLEQQPLAGRSAEEIAPGLRVFSVGKYLVYYARRGDRFGWRMWWRENEIRKVLFRDCSAASETHLNFVRVSLQRRLVGTQ